MPETTPLAFFEDVCDVYQRAEQAVGGAVDRYYAIGGYTVHLRFAGPALVPFVTPALEHLAIPPGRDTGDLTICLWDSASTHVQMPARPWDWDECITHGQAQDSNNALIYPALHWHAGVRRIFDQLSQLTMLDQSSQLAVFWISDPRCLATYERGAPLRNILHWWMRERGWLLVHAGAVGEPGTEKGALIVGKGGSGKSTTALACLAQGWRYAGDDYCLLGLKGTLCASSLYNSAKLDPTHLQKFPRLLPVISNPEELSQEKALLFLYQHEPAQLVTRLPVHAILLSRVTDSETTTWAPISPVATLKALAPSSIFQIPGAGRDDFLTLVKLIQDIPCYSLELGTELDRIPEAISEVLSES